MVNKIFSRKIVTGKTLVYINKPAWIFESKVQYRCNKESITEDYITKYHAVFSNNYKLWSFIINYYFNFQLQCYS